MEVVDHLVSDNVSATHSAGAGTLDGQDHSSTDSDGKSSDHSNHVLSMLAKLHPNDVSKIRDQASTETQDLLAWMRSMSWKTKNERIAAGRPRLLSLAPHPYAMSGSSQPSKNSNSRVWLDMFREGMAWRSWDRL